MISENTGHSDLRYPQLKQGIFSKRYMTKSDERHLAVLINLISAVNSSSVQSMQSPFGGMAPVPFLALVNNAGMPLSNLGFHATASPVIGAPAAPAA